MDFLNPEVSYSEFIDSVRRAPVSLLLSDYDGTLSPFTADRDNARPYDGVVDVLRDIAGSDRARVVVISGRAVADLQRLIGNELGCELWGSHGAERYMPGEGIETRELDSAVRSGLLAIDEWVEDNGLRDSLERKPVGRALHWRGQSDDRAREIKELVRETWSEGACEYGLEIREFDGGMEFRPEGVSKADAVNRILRELSGRAPAAYLGDDQTDEDAFAALKGKGLGVFVSSERRTTGADVRIEPPGELLAFLRDWRAAIVGSQA